MGMVYYGCMAGEDERKNEVRAAGPKVEIFTAEEMGQRVNSITHGMEKFRQRLALLQGQSDLSIVRMEQGSPGRAGGIVEECRPEINGLLSEIREILSKDGPKIGAVGVEDLSNSGEMLGGKKVVLVRDFSPEELSTYLKQMGVGIYNEVTIDFGGKAEQWFDEDNLRLVEEWEEDLNPDEDETKED